MSEISSKYDPSTVEDKWYSRWMEHKLFKSTPDEREPYTIVIPPPNVTGVLHMGHMLNNTIQDVLVRKARLEGKNACWVPGTDHASIATEAKVVAKLKAEGIEKKNISRDEFLRHAHEWKDKHGGIILEQLKKLGASCDWDRERFTMDETYYQSVIDVFVDLYEKGFIYRGTRMVNWDPEALTAVSDEEVTYTEEASKLYHVRYQIAGEDDFVTIATTRPETILGDTAVCVNPNDERYQHLKGKKVLVPLIDREIPVILDDYVAMDFGTGCLKVTPAHDINDYELGLRHNLESINVLNDDGTLSEAAQLFVGEDRFAVRKKIAKSLEASGNLVKVEEYQNKVGRSERTNAVIEPRLSLQWFVKMKDLSKPALDHVMDDTIQFHPAKFKNSYKHWMENIKDWCISRQLWWGHRIPAWYYGKGVNDFVVAANAEEALKKAQETTGNKMLVLEDLQQDPDVVDTWFSSWLWPISVFDGFYTREEVDYYYPTNDLVTAPEIMFFWVARMIMAGYEYEGKPPFRNVYYTGIVRDKLGRKMSKSLGNSPDPIELIQKFSADGVRMGLMITAPAGNDIPFDDSICEQGRNFANKIWNALRLVKGWEVIDKPMPEVNTIAVNWLENRINEELIVIQDHFHKFRISDAMMSTYKLIWDEFCAWYLEAIKPAFGDSLDRETYAQTLRMFEKLMVVLHPFMPFITEEIWHNLKEREAGEFIAIAQWPAAGEFDKNLLEDFQTVKALTGQVRTIRAEKQLPPREQLVLAHNGKGGSFEKMAGVIEKLAGVQYCRDVEQPSQSASFIVGDLSFFVPLEGFIDEEAEKQKMQEELKYQKGFLKSVSAKLSNERFVQNAPAKVVDMERKKMADAQTRIDMLEQKLKEIG